MPDGGDSGTCVVDRPTLAPSVYRHNVPSKRHPRLPGSVVVVISASLAASTNEVCGDSSALPGRVAHVSGRAAAGGLRPLICIILPRAIRVSSHPTAAQVCVRLPSD